MLMAFGAAVIGLGYVAWFDSSGRTSPPAQRPVTMPELSAEARAGKQGFETHCAPCHGAHAMGGPTGPPLVDPIYRPAHHADIAFTLAVRRGVRAHHWRFGDMPPQPSIGEADVRNITRYVRELQRANGIE
jgi:mono/diheme cytochrome c family protein